MTDVLNSIHLSYRNTTIARFQNGSNGICNHCAFKLKLLLPHHFVINNVRSVSTKQRDNIQFIQQQPLLLPQNQSKPLANFLQEICHTQLAIFHPFMAKELKHLDKKLRVTALTTTPQHQHQCQSFME